jgi:SAM-dependent methyltransferase
MSIFTQLSNLKLPPNTEKYAGDQYGHKKHNTKTVDLVLGGQPKGISDVPYITKRLSTKLFGFKVYDWLEYGGSGAFDKYDGYCTGADVVSFSIDVQGVWEGYETVVALDILAHGSSQDGIVLDIGSQLGYYSVLAAEWGYNVVALDSDPESIRMTRENAELNLVADRVKAIHSWLDDDAPVLEPSKSEQVHFLKCDIEGAEQYAVKMTSKLFQAKQIDYAMLEVSPCFNDSYTKLTEEILDCGYDAYQVPHKGWQYTAEYAEEPLKLLKQHCQIQREDIAAYMDTIKQEDLIFINHSL